MGKAMWAYRRSKELKQQEVMIHEEEKCWHLRFQTLSFSECFLSYMVWTVQRPYVTVSSSWQKMENSDLKRAWT